MESKPTHQQQPLVHKPSRAANGQFKRENREQRPKARKQAKTPKPATTYPLGANRNKQQLTVQTAAISPEAWKNLPPLAQHELTVLRPGEMQTPFVENNGIASKLATCVMNGEFTQGVSGGASYASLYTVVMLCPIAAASDVGGTGSTGVSYLDTKAGTYVMTMADVRGMGFTDLYGAATFASRVTPYATRLEVVIEAPEATVSGVAFYGSMAVASLVGSTISSLIQNSSSTVDLKKNPRLELRAAVSNRNLIHFRVVGSASLTTPLDFGDEWVSYIVLDKAAVRSLTDGTPSGYNTALVAHTNAVWWPTVSTPMLQGIVSKIPVSIAPTTPQQESFCKMVETMMANPRPTPANVFKQILAALLSVAGTIPVLAPWVGAARTLSSMAVSALNDPRDTLPDYSGIIADLEWCGRTIDVKYHFSDVLAQAEVEKWLATTSAAARWFRNSQVRVVAVRKAYNQCTPDARWRGSTLNYFHLKENGEPFIHDPLYFTDANVAMEYDDTATKQQVVQLKTTGNPFRTIALDNGFDYQDSIDSLTGRRKFDLPEQTSLKRTATPDSTLSIRASCKAVDRPANRDTKSVRHESQDGSEVYYTQAEDFEEEICMLSKRKNLQK